MTNTAYENNNNLNYINEEQYSPQQANLINSQKLLLGTELNKLYNNIVKDAERAKGRFPLDDSRHEKLHFLQYQ